MGTAASIANLSENLTGSEGDLERNVGDFEGKQLVKRKRKLRKDGKSADWDEIWSKTDEFPSKWKESLENSLERRFSRGDGENETEKQKSSALIRRWFDGILQVSLAELETLLQTSEAKSVVLALSACALFGRVEALDLLLSAGLNPRAVDAMGRTPLHFCALSPKWLCQENRGEVRRILQAWPDPSQNSSQKKMSTNIASTELKTFFPFPALFPYEDTKNSQLLTEKSSSRQQQHQQLEWTRLWKSVWSEAFFSPPQEAAAELCTTSLLLHCPQLAYTRDVNGDTPAHLAAAMDRVDILRVILTLTATALMRPLIYGRKDGLLPSEWTEIQAHKALEERGGGKRARKAAQQIRDNATKQAPVGSVLRVAQDRKCESVIEFLEEEWPATLRGDSHYIPKAERAAAEERIMAVWEKFFENAMARAFDLSPVKSSRSQRNLTEESECDTTKDRWNGIDSKEIGYWDEDGNRHEGGCWDEYGNWHTGGYWDQNGDWYEGGYWDIDNNWHEYSDRQGEEQSEPSSEWQKAAASEVALYEQQLGVDVFSNDDGYYWWCENEDMSGEGEWIWIRYDGWAYAESYGWYELPIEFVHEASLSSISVHDDFR